jgi:Uma2 family endonuclease
VVEIVSPSDSRAKIDRRVRILLENGILAVWIVYPDRCQITVHQSGSATRTFSEGDILDGGDVLPGLSLAVADIFAE